MSASRILLGSVAILFGLASLSTAEVVIRKSGSQFARIDDHGTIRISGQAVGRYESNGTIRKKGVAVGIETNGTLRRDGQAIGRVESGGTIRKKGSAWGTASNCCGSFGGKKSVAAVLVFFADGYFKN